MLKDKGESIELDVVVEKYKKRLTCVKGPDGTPIKGEDGKNIKEIVEYYNGFQLVPTTFIKEGITLWAPGTNHKNQILKTRSTVYDKYTNKFFVVKHRIEEIETVLNTRSVVGFQIGKK